MKTIREAIKEIERAIEYEKQHRNDSEMIADMEKYLIELKK